jgi:hypothetical protein
VSGADAPCAIWTAPAPLCEQALQDPNLERFQQPAILRFKTADQLKQALLPTGLAWADQPPLVVQPETRADEVAGWVAYADYVAHLDELSLYLPAQGRLYLVAADLVSMAPDPTDAKATYGYVVRLLAPLVPAAETDPSDHGSYAEYAWVPLPCDGGAARWQPVGSGPLVRGERVLPAFHRTIPGGQGGQASAKRGMFVGMPAITPAPGPPPNTPPGSLPLAPPPIPPTITSAGQPALELFLSDKFAVFEAAVLEPLRGLRNAEGDQRRSLATWVMISLANYLVVWLPIWQRIHPSGELPVVLQERAEALTWVWARRVGLLAGTLPMPDAVTAWLSADLAPELADFVNNMLWDLAVARGIPGVTLADRYVTCRDYYCIRPVRTLTIGKQSPSHQVGPPSRPFQMSQFDNDMAPQRGE